MDILQTLVLEKHENYDRLVKRLEMRYTHGGILNAAKGSSAEEPRQSVGVRGKCGTTGMASVLEGTGRLLGVPGSGDVHK